MLLTKNNVYIVGELVEVKDFRTLQYGADNKNAVSANIIIKCNLGEQENLIEARTFISEMTSKGTVNKNYNTILNINNWLNKRVVISGGQLISDRFWAANSQQLINSTRVNFNLIREARKDENVDKATFEFGGFVYSPLAEVCDENGNTKYYQMTLGQSNYKEDNMFTVNFIVDKDNIGAINSISNHYEQYATVEISGLLQTIVTQSVKETPVAFGEPVVKTYNNVDKKYIITGGSEVITGEGEYTEEVLKNLLTAYKEEAASIQAKANSTDTKTSTPGAAPKAKKSSLAGLI
jgi:hypothetical protein